MEPVLEVRDLQKYFPVTRGIRQKTGGMLKAVDGISFDLYRGETLGLVGESGCGKTTAGRTIVRLYEPTGGTVRLHGQDIFSLSEKEMLPVRRQIQMIFQDPYSSLNPRMTVGDTITEALEIHGLAAGRRNERVGELLDMVGLGHEMAGRYPHEFSGGQRQRIGVARALAVEPQVIICDEPVSALDVSIQAQVINLLEELQEKLGLTYLFISHDLAVVRHISHRVAVMYLGKLVEVAPSDQIYDNPLHPYTEALMSAIPIPDPKVESQRQRIILTGDVASPIDLPPGCRFASRCPKVEDRCRQEEPAMVDVGGGHLVACHLVG
ncbi:MAG: dipeptide ABC transporter ATP-binding protein [Firmicutes bacterium]|nr:dipeptide ABC transporter ATP-binding protein [Bacillota bacterium]